MSGEKLAPTPSLGEANAEPPTPEETPTSAVLPSPVFETPKNNQSLFERAGGWTPRFAEEYSVFKSTPGNLRASSAFVAPTPVTATATPRFLHQPHPRPTPSATAASRKRPLDAIEIAAEVASHVNRFSPNPNLPLPPVEASKRLASSPGIPSLPSFNDSNSGRPSPKLTGSATFDRPNPGKKHRLQTATPPPTSKRTRYGKPTPRIRVDKMQNEEGVPHPDFMGTPSQMGMANFDLFGYPMSAPPTGATFDNARSFWEADAMAMGTMDMDFTVSADLFQATSPTHRPMGSLDWGQGGAPELFQQPTPAPAMPPASQENIPPPLNTNSAATTTAAVPQAPPMKTVRALAPKPPTPTVSAAAGDVPVFGGVLAPRAEDPFATASLGNAMNPVLFSHPPSSGGDTAPFNPISTIPAKQPSKLKGLLQAPQPLALKGGLRRTTSTREMGTGKQGSKPPLNSPVKTGGLQRSFSDKGKKPMHRASLPTLAPAIKPAPPSVPLVTPTFNSRPIVNPRPSGRVSPPKHHRRLPSLSAIPESSPRPPRTDVKFVIDSRGRARVEPVIVNGAHVPNVDHPPHPPHRQATLDWDSSGDESSDTDDEPIIIPSRNTSFALPDPIQVKPSASFHASQKSLSERSTMSFTSFTSERRLSRDSDTDTVVNDPRNKVSGDAASELRQLMHDRNKRPGSNGRSSRPVSSSFSYVSAGGSLMSPTSTTDSGVPTPMSDSHSTVRCVCNSGMDRGGEYMIQCESCEMWLHGSCLKINRENHPRVYICAFCANTPNLRNGRLRVSDSEMGPPRPIPSPLAHKSLQSFR